MKKNYDVSKYMFTSPSIEYKLFQLWNPSSVSRIFVGYLQVVNHTLLKITTGSFNKLNAHYELMQFFGMRGLCD
jgi:hypothetical protein